mmetsp:Transcript_50301/g.116790  ORF Transcript_50301/g.116790 Transcript_50301/m.116790 type:complete len:235 (+) Transcript_50301:247-951(+)
MPPDEQHSESCFFRHTMRRACAPRPPLARGKPCARGAGADGATAAVALQGAGASIVNPSPLLPSAAVAAGAAIGAESRGVAPGCRNSAGHEQLREWPCRQSRSAREASASTPPEGGSSKALSMPARVTTSTLASVARGPGGSRQSLVCSLTTSGEAACRNSMEAVDLVESPDDNEAERGRQTVSPSLAVASVDSHRATSNFRSTGSSWSFSTTEGSCGGGGARGTSRLPRSCGG